MLEIDWIYHTCCHNYELLIISGQLLCIWSEAILSLMRLQETNKVYDNVPIEDVVNIIRWVQKDLWWMEHVIRACFLSLARSKLRLCSANHRPGYWSNLPCDWPITAWAYSEAIAGAATLVTCHEVQALQLIWRSGTSRFYLLVPDLQISCSLIWFKERLPG